jgi:putative ATP-binding cassette transporter
LQELKAQGKMILAVSHDDRFFDLADHRITLGDGQIRFDSTAPGAGPSTMITRS